MPLAAENSPLEFSAHCYHPVYVGPDALPAGEMIGVPLMEHFRDPQFTRLDYWRSLTPREQFASLSWGNEVPQDSREILKQNASLSMSAKPVRRPAGQPIGSIPVWVKATRIARSRYSGGQAYFCGDILPWLDEEEASRQWRP